MKSLKDPRHIRRRKIVKELFASVFTKQHVSAETTQILSQKEEIDGLIAKSAPTWPIEKINKIDLAILRLAVFEIINGRVPEKVAIDEAVELAKEYGAESSPGFVNGVLGKVMETRENAQN